MGPNERLSEAVNALQKRAENVELNLVVIGKAAWSRKIDSGQ